MNSIASFSCPASNDAAADRVLLAHGEGGSLMRRLLSEHILPRLGKSPTSPLDDAAVLPPIDGSPVISTDAFVVSPLFFPGGDIGALCVYGTVNDLVMRGAAPLWLTLSLVLEEGLPLATLDRVLESAAAAAHRCGVTIVAGDTKVVPRGAADQVFISTTGVGRLLEPAPAGPATIVPGDVLLVSGPVGRHGVAVLAAREEMRFCPPPSSDCAPLVDSASALRDATRGGVAAVLHEWSRDAELTMAIDETCVPVSSDVRGVCELLGLDPLCVANEGTMVVAVAPSEAEAALRALRTVPASAAAAIIGEVRARGAVPVVVRRALGRDQPLIEPSGAPLPRIC